MGHWSQVKEKKMEEYKYLYFVDLDVLPGGLEASPVAGKSFLKIYCMLYEGKKWIFYSLNTGLAN